MEAWTKEQLKVFKPKYKALVENFNKQYPSRIQGMINLLDPHNVNIKTRMTWRTFAVLIEVLPSNLSKVLKGKEYGGSNISLEQAIRICTIFGCTLDYLITGKEEVGTDVTLRESVETERRLRKMVEAENERLRAELEKCKASKRKG
jgi:transcriptional regulator with XRE-family HTH domain